MNSPGTGRRRKFVWFGCFGRVPPGFQSRQRHLRLGEENFVEAEVGNHLDLSSGDLCLRLHLLNQALGGRCAAWLPRCL